MKPFHEMRPGEIIKARDKSGCAFVPVGPIEWHSFHLPIGTDAIIAEQICIIVAEKINGVYFKPLNLGTDEYRREDDLKKWGFDINDIIFGMNFPELPLASEYCSREELESDIRRRLNFLKECKFRYVFVVNHHGGIGQNEWLSEICNELNSKNFTVEFVNSYRFMTLKEKELSPYFGGHAGISETTFLIAFRPDLADLNSIPEGKLIVRKTGVLHDNPVIDEIYNPRNINISLAAALRENIVNNFYNFIKELLNSK
jgi:creatinine amidohydrolase